MPDDATAALLVLKPEVGNATEEETTWPVVGPRDVARPLRLGPHAGPGNAAADESGWPVVSERAGEPSPAEESEFSAAMDRYTAGTGRPAPTWPEVLTVLRSLGYVKAAGSAVRPG